MDRLTHDVTLDGKNKYPFSEAVTIRCLAAFGPHMNVILFQCLSAIWIIFPLFTRLLTAQIYTGI